MALNSSVAFVAAKFVTPDNCLFAPMWDLGEVCALMSLILWVHAASCAPTKFPPEMNEVSVAVTRRTLFCRERK